MRGVIVHDTLVLKERRHVMVTLSLKKSKIGTLLPIVAILMILHCACACSRDAGSPTNGGMRDTPDGVLSFVDDMVLSVSTNGISEFPNSSLASHNFKERSSCRKVVDMILAIKGDGERLAMASNVVDKLLLSLRNRNGPVEELNCFLVTHEILDMMSAAIWETTHDPNMVIALWSRQKHEYARRRLECENELVSKRARLKELTATAYKIQLRLANVPQDELTPEEKSAAKECNADIVPLHQLLGRLERLRKYYEEWDVGPEGKQLMNGELYRRFKQMPIIPN